MIRWRLLFLLLLLLLPLWASAAEPTELERLQARSKELASAIEATRQQLQQRRERQGDLLAAVRLVGESSRKQLSGSLLNSRYPDADAQLKMLQEARAVPDLSALAGLADRLLAELRGQGEIARYETPVIDTDGTQSPVPVTRVGPFVALSQDRYLEYVSELGRFRVLDRQPPGRFLQANGVPDPAGGGYRTYAIDPTRGSLLALLIQTPSLEERLHQGGLVGYLILALALLGLVLALWRILALKGVAGRVARQRRALHDLRADNPLGRVLLAVGDAGNDSLDLVERRLDEAVLKELPGLERGLSLIRLLAAIAPLLGLLGTVVGMILTFQAISLFGSGDPKLMAGGISQALVTTVMGLSAAIPLLLLHSLAAGTSRHIEQVLEEQSAALVARSLEGRGDA